MKEISLIVAIGVFINALVEVGKQVKTDGKINGTMVATIVVGVVLCVVYRLDVLAALGYTTDVPVVGAVFTGIIGSRLSNLIADWNKAKVADTDIE